MAQNPAAPTACARVLELLMSCCFWILFCAVIPLLVHGQSQEGFISIDCGLEGPDYPADGTGINFTSDARYIEEGQNKRIVQTRYDVEYDTLRSFPTGKRNCYTLRPVKPGKRYLIRAAFEYGNSSSFEFDLHVGATFWITVDAGTATEEMIAVVPSDRIWVCLVNTGKGTPFISSLVLRPLPDTTYPLAIPSQSLVLLRDRRNYGESKYQFRFPSDPHDRVWFPQVEEIKGNNRVLKATADKLQTKPFDTYEVPQAVLSTALENSSIYIECPFGSRTIANDRLLVVLHFAELQPPAPNESRSMDVHEGMYSSGKVLFSNYIPPYLMAAALELSTPELGGQDKSYGVSLHPSKDSTRSPMINAVEFFALRQMNTLLTDPGDVKAMENIKRAYKVRRNWMGDPCAPQEFSWERLNCSDSTSPSLRITHLNLSSSGFNGLNISEAFADLTELTTLDLSNNNMTGVIPASLAHLPSLTALILTGNQLMGAIPEGLCRKMLSGTLSLSFEGNRDGCSPSTTKSAKNTWIFVAIALLVFIVLSVLILIFYVGRRVLRRESHDSFGLKNDQGHHRFSFSDIKNMTRNFEVAIGRGGFGVVYLGHLDDGTKVAVKVPSRPSPGAIKEFRSEAQILTRVHHKNLVSLIGYCDDDPNLSLVYEYMDGGTVKDHLSGKDDTFAALCWEDRVKIALHAAQGLDYLHNGCKPPIIHRDVKTANILLNTTCGKASRFWAVKDFPEYCQAFRLDEKSDIYSFGVVLLEIITGRVPFPADEPDATHIIPWVRGRVDCGDIQSIVDGRLNGDYDTDSCWRILEVALACCTASSAARRPSMGNVAMQLRECLAPRAGDHDDEDDTFRGLSMDARPLRSSSGFLPSAR